MFLFLSWSWRKLRMVSRIRTPGEMRSATEIRQIMLKLGSPRPRSMRLRWPRVVFTSRATSCCSNPRRVRNDTRASPKARLNNRILWSFFGLGNCGYFHVATRRDSPKKMLTPLVRLFTVQQVQYAL